MGKRTGRMWKGQDLQGQRPRAWCRDCGREFYERIPTWGLCSSCRKNRISERRRNG